MTSAHGGRIFSIPASLPFLKTVAASLIDGRLVPGFTYDPTDPLALADVTIYVPTRRSARVLRSEFVDLFGGKSAILPVIRALGETDDDSGFFDEVAPALLDMAEPLSGPARLIELARLVLAWRNSLPAAVTSVHAESSLVAPASPADAVWLARNLAEIIDAMETEELDWAALDSLDVSNHALWWQLTAEFLKIASEFWPARLTELGRSSPSLRRNATLHAETERYRHAPPTGPVIIAGSTGSIPATAGLIAAVAKLPNGVVILPGLDRFMSDAEWLLVGHQGGAAGGLKPDAAARSHPQYGLHRLLTRMGATRNDVDPLGSPPDDLEYRTKLLSSAFLPTQATAGWGEVRGALDDERMAAAFREVSLVEAANEREEALAIAIALRLALEESDDAQAALITPDRKLGRRVAAELARFGIEADDSAGTPLLSTPQGTLLRLLVEAALRPGDPVPLVALLKHPLTRFGLPVDDLHTAVTALELTALRGGTAEIDISTLEPLLEAALERQAGDRHPPIWRTALPETAIPLAQDLTRRVAAAVEPLAGLLVQETRTGRRLSSKLPLSDWAERTGRALEAVAVDERDNLAALWSGEAGDSLANLLKSVMETDGQIEADGPQWCDIIEALAASESVKPRSMRHPRVFIFGALESRLQSVDTVVIGGLNEGTWPGQAANDAFLSRIMKVEIGLEPPERRIGQLGHDLQMAAATPKLVLTRALRNGTAPTVASRWLQRLLAVGGPTLAADLRSCGRNLIDWASDIDKSASVSTAPRPAPKPPADLQPKKYSFSEIGRLRRDPYAIYARHILRLHRIAPFNLDPGPAERGSLYHRIVDRFVRAEGSGEPLTLITHILDEEFDAIALPPHIDAVWRPRFAAVARAFVDWHLKRAPGVRETLTEVPASLDLSVGGIRLTGIADRIDILPDGSADIIDYKTGSTPSLKVARALLDPQLALEAAAIRRSAFRGPGQREPANLLYVRLKPGERFEAEQVNNEGTKTNPKSAVELAEDSLAELEKLLTGLIDGRFGFASRLIPEQERDYGGEYDHLARVAEWSSAENGGEGDDV
ncbi:double-strand break repair protein AddB [Shinella curvata]|uniref:Double-strand break repair protein AddB n=1 Tax=Shinella curvata TaxID=1817964 RepID=A0ABT8XKZ4_9HYPH|nr:double-strand break repair protein AddB [Shinella curvata]MCJ8056531.1 double-strand break repair protein AddB [Shinella curvata]MDO6124409.1 double-strand break repair protein AddB [Shinella curvata]